MRDDAAREGTVWAERLVAFYDRRSGLGVEERSALFEALSVAVAGAARTAVPLRLWPQVVNAALDAWEDGRGRRGPRVAYLDHARGHVTTKD